MMTTPIYFKIFPLVMFCLLVGCDGCDDEERFGVWDSNSIRNCMNAENLAADIVNERLEGTWAEDHVSNAFPDSLGPFIDTLVFLGDNQLVVSYEYGYEIQTGYFLDRSTIGSTVNYSLSLDSTVLTLPINDIYYCDDKLFFNNDFSNPDNRDFEYGFNKVE